MYLCTMNNSIRIEVNLFTDVQARTPEGMRHFDNAFLQPLLKACAPPPLTTQEWEVTLYRYIPYKEFGEGKRAECFGARLLLCRTCQSAYQAFLVVQAIRSVTELFHHSYKEVTCFCVVYDPS